MNANSYKNWKNSIGKRKWFKITLIVVFTPGLFSCGEEPSPSDPKEPKIEVVGDREKVFWYKGTSEEKNYLIKNFTESALRKVISWPPHELRRTVDISIDITGSGYQSQFMLENTLLPLGEYNIKRFHDYLLGDNGRLPEPVLQPGDLIFVRLFGEGKNFNQAEEKMFECPKVQAEIEVSVSTRRFDRDLKIFVRKVLSNPVDSLKQTADLIRNWSLQQLKLMRDSSEDFGSPLLTHISRVCNRYAQTAHAKKLFIFVTDGHFSVGDSYYFSPGNYPSDEMTVEKIKNQIAMMQTKPFSHADPNSRVILYGLTPIGLTSNKEVFRNEAFLQAQERIMLWFFEPIDSQVIIIPN